MKKRILQLGTCAFILGTSMSIYGCSKSNANNVINEVRPPKTSSDSVSTDISDLMSYTSGPTYTTQTPMGIHFQSLKTATSDNVAWLADASKEPSLPTGKESSLMLKAFNVKLYPNGLPSPADCNQTALGDCSAISVFAELAYTNPSFIQSIIKDNGDNTYTVSMYDPLAKVIKVTVSNKFMASTSSGGIVAVTGKNSVPTWSTILEKALMKYIDVYKLVSTIEGIGSEYASPTLTGNGDSYAFSPTKLTPEQLKRAVDATLAQGKLVIGGFTKSDVQVGQSKTVSAHAWAFMYPPVNTLNQAMFLMRNPWGNNNGTDVDGLMYIPDNQSVTDLIDLRIINAGAAKADSIPTPYYPPA